MPERQSTWRRAVITGGAGFPGVHLCRSLLAAGAEVLCIETLAWFSALLDSVGRAQVRV